MVRCHWPYFSDPSLPGGGLPTGSMASLPEKRAPATEVNKVRGKETVRGLTAKETRVIQICREDEEKKVTEYYSNDTGRAETSQGLDNRQGKKATRRERGSCREHSPPKASPEPKASGHRGRVMHATKGEQAPVRHD